jgi:TetR/AcrR family transcriptional repressor of nem operon
MRSSREDTEKHRREIIAAAARLFREKGVDGVSVPDLMQAAGMTHGGFYRHFASKDELVPLAYREAFDQIVGRLSKAAAGHDGDRIAAWNAMVTSYLSPAHRENIADGCAAASLAGDAARLEPDNASQGAFQEGIRRMLQRAEAMQEGPDARQESLVALSTLVGALVLARGTDGELSDAFLEAAREHLLKPGAAEKR